MGNQAFSEQEITQLRAETRGTTEHIHFNNAGSSFPPDSVVETVVDYLQDEAMIGGYEAEAKYKNQLEETYSLIAKLINADTDEVAIVENASIAWGIAFNGITFNEGDEIIASEMEYVTNVLAFQNAQNRHGAVVKYIPNDENGNFLLNELEKAITPKTKLIAITHIASTTGGIMPIVAIGKIARKHCILYLVDACQSVGQLPVNVKDIGCDMLSVTGRKYLRAPRGTGFLYIRKEIQDQIKPSFIDGRSITWINETGYELRADAKRFELYENSRALTLGLAKAVDYALNIGIDRIWARVQHVAGLMRSQLKAIEGIAVHDFGDEQCGIVTFTVNEIDSQLVKAKLAEKNINVSVGLAKSTLVFMNRNKLDSVVRASVHYYNTAQEIDTMCYELASIANGH